MSDLHGAIVPFLKDSKDYKPTLLYKSTYFLIASGEDKDYTGYRSIGVRWRKSRNESNQNPLGFPLTRGTIKCWFIMPNDLALCLLNHIKDSNECINKDETNKAIQELTETNKRRVK